MSIKRTHIAALVAVTAGSAGLLYGCGGNNDAKPLDTQAVMAWNAIATQAVAEFGATDPMGGLAPMQDSRVYAMAFSAMHDALNAIDRRYKPYLSDLSAPDASPDAAVAQSVHDVMVNQLPAEQTYLDGQLASSLAAIPTGDAKTKGIALGQQTAAAILAARANDGAATGAGPGYTPASSEPGVYQATQPIGNAFFVGWGQITPFVLSSATQFRSPPNYAVSDPQFAADFNEIKSLGRADSTARSADQTQIANFWAENCPDGWDRIAATVATAKKLNGWDQARLFATLELAEADSYIASLNDKYHYAFWRPLTALSASDSGNPAAVPDPSWQPLQVTPPIPDYPSAHAHAGGTAAAVLADFFGSDAIAFSTTSGSLPGVTRSYTSFSQAAKENADSRVYIGFHFRNATVVGLAQGQKVGDYDFNNTLGKAK